MTSCRTDRSGLPRAAWRSVRVIQPSLVGLFGEQPQQAFAKGGPGRRDLAWLSQKGEGAVDMRAVELAEERSMAHRLRRDRRSGAVWMPECVEDEGGAGDLGWQLLVVADMEDGRRQRTIEIGVEPGTPNQSRLGRARNRQTPRGNRTKPPEAGDHGGNVGRSGIAGERLVPVFTGEPMHHRDEPLKGTVHLLLGEVAPELRLNAATDSDDRGPDIDMPVVAPGNREWFG